MGVIERWHVVGVVIRGPAGGAGDGTAGHGPGAGSGGGDTTGHIASVEFAGPLAPFAPVAPVRPAPLQDLIAG